MPVVVIGNLTVGGTGKSPLVAWLVEQLAVRGVEAGILSRGYGGESKTAQFVTTDTPASRVGDEAVMHARRTSAKVVVAPRRSDGAKLLEQAGVDLIVCDDGLQHLGLVHDLALRVFDERGLGNGWLLPAGPLREAWPVHSSGHSHVMTVSTSNYARHDSQPNKKHEQPQVLNQLSVDFVVPRVLADFAKQSDGTTQALSIFQGEKVQALAGIGKPQVFFDMLTDKGIALSATKALADHDDMRSIHIDPGMGEVLCTEKDAVKLWNFQPTAWAVPLVTEIPEELLNTILAHIGPKLSSAHGHKTS